MISFILLLFIVQLSQSSIFSQKKLKQGTIDNKCKFLDFIHFNIIQFPEKSYLQSYQTLKFVNEQKTKQLWFSLCKNPPQKILDQCGINISNFVTENDNLKLRRIIAIEIDNSQNSKNLNQYSHCSLMTISGIEAIYYSKVDQFSSFEEVLPAPKVREGIELVFEKYSIKLFVPGNGDKFEDTEFLEENSDGKMQFSLPMEPQRDTPVINLVFPWSRAVYENPLFWFTKIINFLVLLPLFLLRRVGQEYHFFEFMAFWLAIDWIMELTFELATISVNFDSWIGWPLWLGDFTVLFLSFVLVRYCVRSFSSFFIWLWVIKVAIQSASVSLYISTLTFLFFMLSVALLVIIALIKPNTYLRCGWLEYIYSICASYQFLTYPIYSFLYNGTYVGTLVHLTKGFKHYHESVNLGLLLNLSMLLVPLLSYLRVGNVSTKRVKSVPQRLVGFDNDYVSISESRLGYASMIKNSND